MARVSQHTIKYRHIIETVCKDLDIDPPRVTWHKFKNIYGDYDRLEYLIRISADNKPIDIIKTIMHECRHLWQHKTGIFKGANGQWRTNKRGNLVYIHRASWNGVEYDYLSSGNRSTYDKYRNQPHEIDAFDYEDQIDRLFPGDLNAYLNTGKKASKNPILDKKVSCVVYFASGKVNYVQTVRSAYEMGIDPNSLKDLDRVKLRNAINNVKAKGVL